MNAKIMRRCVLLAIALVAAGERADAEFTINISQVGSDVQVVSSGRLNLTGLSTGSGTNIGAFAQMFPSYPLIFVGRTEQTGLLRYAAYFSGPPTFGTGGNVEASSGAGDLVAIALRDNRFYVSASYASNAPLSAANTYANQTFASLGLTAGTYIYTYSATPGGATVDSITIRVGSVPEPASLVMLCVGLAGVGFSLRRRQA